MATLASFGISWTVKDRMRHQRKHQFCRNSNSENSRISFSPKVLRVKPCSDPGQGHLQSLVAYGVEEKKYRSLLFYSINVSIRQRFLKMGARNFLGGMTWKDPTDTRCLFFIRIVLQRLWCFLIAYVYNFQLRIRRKKLFSSGRGLIPSPFLLM